MKTFSFSSLALATSIISLATAAPAPDNALVQRQTHADAPAALAIVNQLFTDVTKYTAVISTPLLNLPARMPPD